MTIAREPSPARAAEYEVKGRISQTITAPPEQITAEFTVSVRDCGWLIQTIEDDRSGNIVQREIGSTNGSEIFELVTTLQAVDPPPDGRSSPGSPVKPRKRPPQLNTASIISNSVPVGFLDISVVGHLWLMFASQCYWPDLKTNQLTPVYDWHACAGANPNLKVKGEWELLGATGSLPREVVYLGRWDETIAVYRTTRTNSTDGILIPGGFVFEQYRGNPQAPERYKMAEATVTSVHSKSSRTNLLPDSRGPTLAVDYRIKEASSARVPTYRQPVNEGWPSVDKAKELLAAKVRRPPPKRSSPILIVTLCSLLLAPLLFYFPWKKWKRSRSQIR